MSNHTKEYIIEETKVEAFENHLYEGMRINWVAKGIGFGAIDLYLDKRDGNKLKCDNEYMSKEFVKAVFNHAIEQADFQDK